jgi:hypothetical protein
LALAGIAVAFVGSTAAPVWAAPGSGSAQHYTAAYPVDFTGDVAPGYTGPVDLGYWSCTGVRVTNNNMVRDNFTCSTTATDVTATFSQNQAWPCGCTGWVSDFDGQVATAYEIDISGGSVNGWATY